MRHGRVLALLCAFTLRLDLCHSFPTTVADPQIESLERRQAQPLPGKWQISRVKDNDLQLKGPINDASQFVPLEPHPTPPDNMPSLLMLSYNNDSQLDDSTSLWDTLEPYLKRENTGVYLPVKASNAGCAFDSCVHWESCNWFYKCFFQTIAQNKSPSSPRPVAFDKCIAPVEKPELQCFLAVHDPSATATHLQDEDCVSPAGVSAQERWEKDQVDYNIQAMLNGGSDQDGVYWFAPDPGQTFLGQIGNSIVDQNTFFCGLKAPCDQPWDCHTIGSRWTLELGKAPLRSSSA